VSFLGAFRLGDFFDLRVRLTGERKGDGEREPDGDLEPDLVLDLELDLALAIFCLFLLNNAIFFYFRS